MSKTNQDIDQDIIYAGGTLGRLIVDAVQRYPSRTAFVDASGSITYAELGQRISQAIQVFEAIGLAPGDVVAQLSGNRIEMFCVMAAAYVWGLSSVTLHSMAGDEDHEHALKDCRARVLVCEAAYAERAAQLRATCGAVSHWFSHDDGDRLPHFWSMAQRHSPQPLVPCGEPEAIIRIAYTGGTTGQPKGVMLSQRAMLANALLWLAGLVWPDGVRCLCSAPISHGTGSLIFPTLVRGGTVFLQRGFDKDKWLATVAERRIQVTFIVPTMLYGLLDYPRTRETDLSSLLALVYGAAPASPVRIRRALEIMGPVLVQSYGQTEAPNTILLFNQHDHAHADERRLASAGRPFPGLEVQLLGDGNTPVATGEVGEICVRGPLVMSGYLDLPEQTRTALDGGWLHTGDLARRDEDGFFYIVDRKKDMIISGGFNVFPKEVEDALMSHPDVLAVAVIGVPDDKWGEAVKAVVVPRPGTAPTAESLIDHVRRRKGPVCAPKSIDFADSLPLTGLGKPDRKALRQKYWAGAARSIF